MQRCSVSYGHEEMQINITMKYYFTVTRMAKLKKKKKMTNTKY